MTDKTPTPLVEGIDSPTPRRGRPASGVDRKTQLAGAQRKRREKLKAEGKKAITVYLDAETLVVLAAKKKDGQTQAEQLEELVKLATGSRWDKLKSLFG
jgi:hypothetical protein